ncbi:YafY family transcriptional regulator [Burkholderiaceae bacterium DAT-1]|nr:YafY family transcriptional regulator [Burkholderiaceae bacterium DAT-1]
MSRAQRLLDLLQLLRRHRFPVTGAVLAESLGISLRTLYRDIAELQAQGASIDGEPGLGYVLRPGFMLPPLMFSQEELEALVLGVRWVAFKSEPGLGAAARNALAKIEAVLPEELRREVDQSGLLVGPPNAPMAGDIELPRIRLAIRLERVLTIAYRDAKGDASTRTIWPIALAFFDQVRVVVAWCELRQSFRHFRTDRIESLQLSDSRYPKRRLMLLKAWRELEGIGDFATR